MNTRHDEWDPEHYKKFARQAERGLAEIEAITLRGDEQVLDVGCGDGRISAALAARVPKGSATGLDISERMIESAQKTYVNVGNLSFVCEDITKFHKPDFFDVIISFAALHWVKDQATALKIIHDSVKKGGRFYLVMSPREDGPIPQTFASERWRSVLKRQQDTYFGRNADELSVLLEHAGFSSRKVHCEKTEAVFNSAQEFVNQLLTWLPYATGLSGLEARECAQDIVNRAIKLKDGRFSTTTSILYAQATK